MSSKRIKISNLMERNRHLLDAAWMMERNRHLLDAAWMMERNRHLLDAAWMMEQNFYLPEIAETTRLLAKLQSTVSREVAALKLYCAEQTSLQRAVERMRTPWLNAQDPLRSMGGFAALQGIGHALKDMPAFGHALGDTLRVDLGDWRDAITWPREIFTDYAARADFYVSRGFNPALTDFPAPAFEESLNIAGLRHEPPSLVGRGLSQGAGKTLQPGDGSGVIVSLLSESDEDEDEGFARTNRAHRQIFWMETELRQYLDTQMTGAFGPDWPKHRLTNGLYDEWQEKKRKAQQGGRGEDALIAYADFTDYELVICKQDNWKSVFKPFFGRKEDVRESFQRLYPVRLDTMHARPITQDDELLLYVETRRLWKAMMDKK